MNILQLVRSERDQPISSLEIVNVVGDKVPIYYYNKVKNSVYNISDLFKKQKCFILFINNPMDPDIGHFVAFTTRKNEVYYFDSYGNKTNEIILNTHPKIMEWLIGSGMKFFINESSLQDMDSSQTCGRYALMRCLLNKLSNEEFKELINKKVTLDDPDDLITICTLLLDLVNTS